jgi:hypothetical protein
MALRLRYEFVCVVISLLVLPALAQLAVVPGDSPVQNHPDGPQPFPNFAHALTAQVLERHPAKTRRTVVQVIPATHRMEVHMPLHMSNGETIATFVCVWNFKDKEEAPELMRKSQQIRDEIAPGITSIAQLLGKP